MDQLRFKLASSENEIGVLRKRIDTYHDTMERAKRANEAELLAQAEELCRARLELDSIKKQSAQKDMFEKEIFANHQKTLGMRWLLC